MGLGDWRMIVALLTSFVAKENTIATLGVLFGAGGAAASLAARGGRRADPGRAARVPRGADAVHPLRGHRGDDQAGDALLAVDRCSIGLMLAISLGAGIIVYQLVIRL